MTTTVKSLICSNTYWNALSGAQQAVYAGGHYTTISGWEAASPADLVAVDQIWQGCCANETFNESVAIGGVTTNASCYVELTTESGASFADNANVRTNALRANAANGAIITQTSGYTYCINVNGNYTRVSKLQFKNTGGNHACAGNFYGDRILIDACIFEGDGIGGTYPPFSIQGGYNNTVKNTLVVLTGAGGNVVYFREGPKVYNCTLVYTSTAPGLCISGAYNSTGVLKNVYCAGTDTFNGSAPTVTNCYTSDTTPPSGFTTAAYSTAQFENITAGTHDFRLKAGSALIDAGSTDATNSPLDITGLARSGAWDVGAWEYAATGGGDVTVSPGKGALTLSGKQPTVGQPNAIAPAIAHAAFSGKIPTISQPVTVSPGIKHAALNGKQPTVAQPSTVSPAVGHGLLTGKQPNVLQGAAVTVSPAAGHVLLSGKQPSLAQPNSVSPAVGHAVIAGKQPNVQQGAAVLVYPGVAHVVLSGKQPSIAQPSSVTPAVVHALLNGKQPNVLQGAAITVYPGSLHTLLTGKTPAVTQTNAIYPSVLHSVFSGHAPSIDQGGTFTGSISDSDIARIADAVMARLAVTGVDVKKVNGVTVTGAGVAGNYWGPA